MRRGNLGGLVLGAALATACGPSAPTPAPVPAPLATGVWAPDLAPVTLGIVEELRSISVDADMGARVPAGVFSAGGQRIHLGSHPDDYLVIHVYRTTAQAQSEAVKIPSAANEPRPPLSPLARVTYARPMHFYYRDRVIAAYGGCTAPIKSAMETLFGPPVQAPSACW